MCEDFYSNLVLGGEDIQVYLTLKRKNRKRALILPKEYLYALIYEVLVGGYFMSSSGDRSIACIIKCDHPIISYKSLRDRHPALGG
jgi:hypothetical protein